jgi:hypothetical protein
MNISVGKFTDIFNTEHKRKKNELNFGKNYFFPECHRKRLERKKVSSTGILVFRSSSFLLRLKIPNDVNDAESVV